MTLTDRLAKFFRERPEIWIDGRVLAQIAGAYAWRTQASRLRREPFRMTVENRQRRITRPDGSAFTVSEYRYQPAPSSEIPERRAVCQCGGHGWISVIAEADGIEMMRRCVCRSGATTAESRL